jgi:MFS family permease
VFLFLTYFLQRTRGMNPIETGLAFLPLAAGVAAASTMSNIKLVGRFGPRPVMAAGMTVGAGAMAWLAQLTPSSGYFGHVLAPLVVLGLGYGATNGPAFFTATANIDRANAGIASAMANTAQQIGGAIGAACLSTIFASAVSSDARLHSPAVATVHGYTIAFWVAAAAFAVGAAVVGSLIPGRQRLTGASAGGAQESTRRASAGRTR